jgi:4-alpha-glucanotransferase
MKADQTSALHALAKRAGILAEYRDQTGRETRRTSDETRLALLAAMGFSASDEPSARRELDRLDAERAERVLEPVTVLREHVEGLHLQARFPPAAETHARWRAELIDEAGELRAFEGDAAVREHRLLVPVPAGLLPGYYTFRIALESAGATASGQQSLIIAPARAPLVEELAGGRDRLFGLFTNLYSVRGNRDWGVGDLSDLGELAEWCAELGGAFVGVNPLHALRNRGTDVSPYGPISRLFRNEVYIDVEAVPELAESRDARALLRRGDVRTALEQLRSATRIDYKAVAEVKRMVLDVLYREFERAHQDEDAPRSREFREWVQARGSRLRAFATFMALDDHFGHEPGGWTRWPEPYRTPHSAEVLAFAEAHRGQVDYHVWVQFEFDRQLGVAAARASAAGMPIGIYQDLAIGTAAWGSDVWTSPQLFASGVSIGAPPDDYSATGQDWGLPPLDPHRLRESGYGYWIALLRSAFGHAGALRIDHVLGLFRQFWIPHGKSGEHGAYVRFPSEDLLGILALEAYRHRALVVGEDLGTVPPEVGPALERWGILGSRVMYFERNEKGAFKAAREYPWLALTTANTHDLPTLAGFWKGSDVTLRRELGLIASDEDAERAREDRDAERQALLKLFRDEGVLDDGEEPDATRLREAVHDFLDRTPSALVGISLDDVAGETEPVNVPGVPQDRFPSWSRRMGRSIAELRDDPVAPRVARCEGRAL